MKRLLACLLALCLALTLCACAETPRETEPAKTASAETKPAETEPAKTEPVETKPVETEPTETVPAWTEPGERIRGDSDLIAPFAELWSRENLEGYVRINQDWTWEHLDADGVFVEGGACSYLEGYGLILEGDDGTDWDYLSLGEDGHIYNSAFMPMTMEELPGPGEFDDESASYPYELPLTNGYSKLAVQIYWEIYPMVQNLEDFSYSSADYEPAYMSALDDAYDLLVFRHPETRMYFRLDETTDGDENKILYANYGWEWDDDADEELIREKLDDFEDRAVKIAARIQFDDNPSAYDLYLRLASVICSNADYDYNDESGFPTSPWAGVMGGTCLSEGYAAAMQYLCSKANLYCEVIEGESRGEHHAWNLVKLPSGTYYIDLAWADQAGEPESAEWMAYFMMNHDQILQEYELWD